MTGAVNIPPHATAHYCPGFFTHRRWLPKYPGRSGRGCPGYANADGPPHDFGYAHLYTHDHGDGDGDGHRDRYADPNADADPYANGFTPGRIW
jgi:hypothetical protein